LGLEINEKEFLVLNYLDIFGATADLRRIQKSTGLESEEVVACLSKLAEKRLVVKETRDIIEKWKITSDGERVVNSYRQLALERTGQRETIIKKFEEFENIYNMKFKHLATAWQVKIVNGRPVVNDHSDPEYDSAILNQVLDLHKNVLSTLKVIAGAIPMFRIYIERLDDAAKKMKENPREYFIRNEDSYHNVWFELHENVLRLWGRERRE
jgi:predicted transcriptional regulator